VEAIKLGYKKGIAASLVTIALHEQNSDTIKEQFRLKGKVPREMFHSAEEKLNQAILLAESIRDNQTLGRAYEAMAFIFLKIKDSKTGYELYKKSLDHFQKAGDLEQERRICVWLGGAYFDKGKYEDAFVYFKRSVLLARIASPITDFGYFLSSYAFFNMAELYKSVGDYETALSYYREGALYAKSHASFYSTWTMDADIGLVFFEMSQFDSSLFYLQKFMETADPKKLMTKIIQGKIYLITKEYDKAVQILKKDIDSLRKRRTWYRLNTALMMTGSANAEKKNYKAALMSAREAVSIAEVNEYRQLQMDGYNLLAKVFHQLNKNDSAYFYQLKYSALRDSLLKIQFLWKLNDFKSQVENDKKESQLALLNKDNKIKEQQLKQEAMFKKFLIAVFIAIIFAGLYVFRNLTQKRKNEKLRLHKNLEVQQLESEKKQAELEMQALRAQMNPHFIFNCLSSINRFILKNESKIASNYLTRFSRLMRMVLMNSQKPLISLEDELQMLGLYLEMERLRFKNSFDYGITFLNAIDSDNVFIPPLLLQPFCENAIWHGLMHKEGQGRLDIELSMENNILNCVITDNGVGLEKSEEMKSKTAEKEKSMGLKITTERLALLNHEKGLHTFYEIEDLKDESGNAAGTKVILKIRFKESMEELV
jgi:tetratricopeptide (TPR) repeat protein